MSEEVITIDYREISDIQSTVSKANNTNNNDDYVFSPGPVISSSNERIIPIVKTKKLDRDSYRSVKFTRSKLIKKDEQSEHRIRRLQF